MPETETRNDTQYLNRSRLSTPYSSNSRFSGNNAMSFEKSARERERERERKNVFYIVSVLLPTTTARFFDPAFSQALSQTFACWLVAGSCLFLFPMLPPFFPSPTAVIFSPFFPTLFGWSSSLPCPLRSSSFGFQV